MLSYILTEKYLDKLILMGVLPCAFSLVYEKEDAQYAPVTQTWCAVQISHLTKITSRRCIKN